MTVQFKGKTRKVKKHNGDNYLDFTHKKLTDISDIKELDQLTDLTSLNLLNPINYKKSSIKI